MKTPGHKIIGIVTALSAIVLMAGCLDDGSDGSTGATGSTPTTVPATSTAIQDNQNLPGLNIVVTSLSGGSGPGGNFRVGDTITVNFTVKKSSGVPLLASDIDSSGILVSGPTYNYQRVIPRISNWHTTATQNSDGSFTYTFPSAIPSTYAAPYYNSGPYDEDEDELAGTSLVDGTYTIGMLAYRTYYSSSESFRDVGNAEKDFIIGSDTTIEPRAAVTQAACNQCHVTLQMHGGSYRDVKLCILCHTTGAREKPEYGTDPIDFRVMIHKIHNGAHLPSVQGVTTDGAGARVYDADDAVAYSVANNDFSEVQFPVWPSMSKGMPYDTGFSSLSSTAQSMEDTILKGVVACDKCHGDDEDNVAYIQPSRRACGSCHDDIDWSNPYVANGQTMTVANGQATCNTGGCHTSSGTSLSVVDAHLHPNNDTDLNPGLEFAISAADRIETDGDVGAGNFANDDRVRLTFTLKNEATPQASVNLATLDSVTMYLIGPTTNRQQVLPNVSISPFDYAGRLVSGSTSNKGAMSKIVDATVKEVITVLFTSATAFNVIGSASVDLGTGFAMPSASTNPSSSSISAITIAPDLPTGNYAVTFSSAQAFAVTGPGGASLGGASLPKSTSTSTRFISPDGKFQCTVTVGSTAFTAGQVINFGVYQAGAANPFHFAIVRGKTNFAANDRFYYETIDSDETSYVYNIPMDISFEFLGLGDGATTAFTAGNTPLYPGRQSVWLVSAAIPAAGAAAAAVPDQWAKYIDMLPGHGIVATDSYLVLDRGVAATREVLKINRTENLDNGNTRIWFTTPTRYARTAVPTMHRVTASADIPLKLEGVDYTLTNATTGVITFAAAPAADAAVVMSYRTDGRFGWRRANGDTLQTVYSAPLGDLLDYEQDWGEWRGLSYVDGTYTVGMNGYKQFIVGPQGEFLYYRAASDLAHEDILYGDAEEVEPYSLISSQDNCDRCHTDVMFHGTGRGGADTCLMCHGVAGAQMSSGDSVSGRTMLHKIHRGSGLTNALTYFDGDFAEVEYPAMPGGVKHCTTCHGTSNAWKEPSEERTHEDQTDPTRAWRSVCGSCHDSESAAAHFNLMTDDDGNEACGVCHGINNDRSVELMHKNR